MIFIRNLFSQKRAILVKFTKIEPSLKKRLYSISTKLLLINKFKFQANLITRDNTQNITPEFPRTLGHCLLLILRCKSFWMFSLNKIHIWNVSRLTTSIVMFAVMYKNRKDLDRINARMRKKHNCSVKLMWIKEYIIQILKFKNLVSDPDTTNLFHVLNTSTKYYCHCGIYYLMPRWQWYWV